MKAAIVLAVVTAIGLALYVQQKKQRREADLAREAAAEAMYKRQDQRVREQRESLRLHAKERREEEVRLNAAERDRIAAKYPELYRGLATKAGSDLGGCVVTERVDPTMVMLSARCGESLDELVHDASR